MPIIPVNQNEIDPTKGVAPINRGSAATEPEQPILSTKFTSKLPTHIGRVDDNITEGVNTADYKKYVPQGNVFVNEGLDDARALGQGSAEQWRNGVIKFAGKTTTAVAGGTIGTLIGLPNIFREGKSFYDTEFQRMLDKWNEDMDEALPNYTTKLEREENFLQSLNNANFWANDVLSGLSFTVGAVLTEMAWTAVSAATFGATVGAQAAGTASLVARAARYLKNFSKGADAVSQLRLVNNLRKGEDALKIMRQMVTGAGYEAGVEARQHKMELMGKLQNEWLTAHPEAKGVVPDSELARMDEIATTSANGVFAANIGIVGLGNMIALPAIFGPGAKAVKPSTIVSSWKEGVGKIFTPEFKNLSTGKKFIQGTYLTAKNPFVEGVWEEGMQGVANTSMQAYTTKKYNPDAQDSVVNLLDSIGEGFAETYGGKQGWKEIGIGMLIGSIGSPNIRAFERKDGKLQKRKDQPLWTGGIAGEFQEKNASNKEAEEVAARMNKTTTKDLMDFIAKNPESLKSSKALFEHAIRTKTLNEEIDNAIETGNIFEAKNAEHDLIHSYISARIEGGYEADLSDEIGKEIRAMKDEEFAKMFGYANLSESEISSKKQETISNFEKKVKKISDITKIVDNNFRADLKDQRNRDAREALIYAGSVIDNVDTREQEIADEIHKLTGVLYDKKARGEEYKKEFETEITEALKENPVARPEVEKLIPELQKLQDRRERFIQQYNYLFTNEGRTKYKEAIDKHVTKIFEDARKKVITEYENTAIVSDPETGKRFKHFKKSDGKHVIVEIDENDKIIDGTEQEVEINDEFVEKYDLEKATSGRQISVDKSKALIKKLNEFTDPEELTNFINSDIKPLNLANSDLVRREAAKVYRKLTGTALNMKNPRHVDKIYVEKATGRRLLVKKDNNKENTYYVKNIKDKDNTKNIEVVTKEELNKRFMFHRAWDNYKFTLNRISNLEEMIAAKESLLDMSKDDKRYAEKQLLELQVELEKYIAELRKKEKDGRSTLKSIEKVESIIFDLQSAAEGLQSQIDKAVKAQVDLNLALEYLYARLQEESETTDFIDLKTKVNDIKEEIAYNEDAILSWKHVLKTIQDLIDSLLKLIKAATYYTKKGKEKLAEEYKQQLQAEIEEKKKGKSANTTMTIGGVSQKVANFHWYKEQKEARETLEKRVTARKAAIQKAIDKGVGAQEELDMTEVRMREVEKQIASFEEANKVLRQRLEFIKEEVGSLREYNKKLKRTVQGVANVAPKVTNKANKEVSPIEQVHTDESSVPTVPSQDETESKQIWSGVKRSLENVFRGLTGKHVESDGRFTSDASQRRYYRWTSKTNIASGNYSIKIVRAFEEDRERIERGGYVFNDTFYAIVVDKEGKYVLEDGSVSNEFDKNKNIYTSFPLNTLSTTDYGDKYFTPQTDAQWNKYYPGLTVAQAKDAFEAQKVRLVEQHNRLRIDIRNKLDKGQEVVFKLVDKAVGVPNDPFKGFKEDTNLSVKDVLGHTDVDIVVNTLETMPVSGGKVFTNLRKGITFIHDRLTGNTFEARPRKLKTSEIDMVINMFKSYAKKSKIEDDKIISVGASELTAKDGSVITDMFKVLSDLVFWTGNNLKKDNKGEYTLPLNTNPKTLFHFVHDFKLGGKTVPGGGIQIGNKVYPLFIIEEGNIVLNRAVIDENGNGALRDFLTTRYVNINSAKLNKEEDFLEVTGVDENGVATYTIHKKDDGGYRHYLLGDESGERVLNLSVIPTGTEQEVALGEDGKPIVEEIPQSLNQYAIYEAPLVEEIVPEVTELVPEEKPTDKYTKLKSLKKGDRIRVEVQQNGKIVQRGTLEVDEDNKLSPISGNLSIATVDNLNRPADLQTLNEIMSQINVKYFIADAPRTTKEEQQDQSVVEGLLKKEEKAPAVEEPAAQVVETEVEEEFTDGEEKVAKKDEKEVRRTNKKGSNFTNYRTPTNDNRGLEDIEKARVWFKERFPNVDFEVVQRLIDGKYHGQFKDAVTYIYEHAEVGTTYHEAFHVTTHLFLTKRERFALYDEWRRRNPNEHITTQEIEERLAEEFRDYILSKEGNGKFNVDKYKTPIKYNFFEKLYNFIKNWIFGKPDSIAEVFEKIESKGYRNVLPNTRFSKGVVLNKAFLNKDEAFTRAALESVNYFFFQKLFSSRKNVSTLYSKEGNKELVAQLYDYAYDQIERRIGDLQDEVDAETNETRKAYLENVIDGLWYVLDNWNFAEAGRNTDDKLKYSVRGLHREFLSQYKLEFVDADQDISELDKTADPDNQWANESIKISAKMNATRSIKLLLGTLIDINSDGSPKMNMLELPQNADFGYTFNVLANRLAGLSTIGQMKAAIHSLIAQNSDLKYLEALIRRLKMEDAPSSLSREDMLQQIQFVQTFSKTKNKYVFDITGTNGKFKIIDSNAASITEKIRQDWRNKSTKRAGVYKVENNVVIYDKDRFEKIGIINTAEKAFGMLDLLGITFSDVKKITDSSTVIKKAEAIRKQILKGQTPIFETEVDANVQGDLDYFLELERQITVDFIENGHYNIEGHLVYDVTLNNYLSLIVNDLQNAQTLDEFLAENPHLNPDYNRYTASSLWLKKGGPIFDKDGNKRPDALVVEIHEGSKEEESGEGKNFEDLGQPDQLRVHINRALQGAYPMLRPADNSIERYFNFGRAFLSGPEIANEEHLELMIGYLRDELLRAKDILAGENNHWNNYLKNAKSGILIDMISHKIVDGDNSELIKDALESLMTDEEYTIEQFFADDELMSKIEDQLRLYFRTRTDEMIATVTDFGIVQDYNETEVVNNGLNVFDNSETLTRNYLRSVIRDYVVNDTISNIEQTKIFLADPINYKSVADEFKRHSGAVGTKKISAVYDEVNKWIKEHLVRTDRKGGLYKNDKPILRTVVFDDVIVKSRYYEQYAKLLGEKAASAYAEMTEGDGQGYITIDEWREFLFRAGDWSFGEGSLEDLYQYEIQKERGVEEPTDPETGRVIIKSKLPVANPLKPQYLGPLAEDGFILGFYKTSFFPLLPSVTAEFSQLEALRLKLKSDGIGVAVFASANKVGTKLDSNGKIQSFYNDKGEFAHSKTPLITQDTYYKYWGIQVDMGSKTKKKVVSGTQMAKQIMNGIFERGKAKNEELGKLATEYMSLNKQRIEIGMSQLIDTLGLSLDGDNYVVKDIDSLILRFQKEAVERELPDNIVDAIGNLRLGNGVDTLVNREKIENILFAIADSMSTSQKRSGSAKVQVSNAIGKSKRVRQVVDNTTGQVWDSSDLKFYMNEDGHITQMEVYLPAYFKGINNNPRLMELIGFRIPTQGLNSIDSIKVKGFLPAAAGDCVIVPSEIVAKAGSDFDIDKLNLYYPNFYYDKKGNPKYITNGSEENLRKEYDEYTESFRVRFIEKIINKELFKSEYKHAIKTVHTELGKIFKKKNFTIEDVIEGLNTRLSQFKVYIEQGNARQKFAYGEMNVIYQDIQQLLAQVADEIRNNPNNEFEPMSFSEFQKRAIENRMSEVQKDIILHPDNFAQLIAPISAAELSEEAKDIRELKGLPRTEKPTMRNIVERKYLMSVARRFLGGKQAVGITAIHSTFDILSKMNDVSIVEKITNIVKGKPIEIETKINLPHNTNEEGLISLSKLTDSEGKGNIPQMISQWINAAVDAAKDPFMFDLNAGPDTLNVVLYLTMAGVPLKYLSRFMSQPIILEYLHNRMIWESQMMEENTTVEFNRFGESKETSKKKFRDEIVSITKAKYGNKSLKNPVTSFSIEQLEDNIKKGSKNITTEEFAGQQLQILDDFLRYTDTARKLGEGIRGTDYDTNVAGKNTSELIYKIRNTQEVIAEGALNNYTKILDESFIAPYYKSVRDLRRVFAPFFTTLKDPAVIRQFDKLLDILFADENKIRPDEKITVIDKFKQDFITYLFITRPYSISGHIVTKDGVSMPMNTQIDRLFKDKKTNIAAQLGSMKAKYPNMEFLKQLEPVESDKDTNHVIIRAKKIDSIESNMFTNEWRELFSSEPQFASDLVLAGLLQYGIQNSPFTYVNLIPFEIYGEMMNSIMEREKNLSYEERSQLYDEFFTQFFLNNYNDNNIVPKKGSTLYKAGIYPFYKIAEIKKEYQSIKRDKKKISDLKSRGINIWNKKPSIFNTSDNTRVTDEVAKKDFRNKSLLNSYGSTNINATKEIDTFEEGSPIDELGLLQASPNTLLALAQRWGIEISGFFNRRMIDDVILKAELVRRGFNRVQLKKSSAGTFYLADNRGRISYDRLQSEYGQFSSGSNQRSNFFIDQKMKTWLLMAGIEYRNVESITDRYGNPISGVAKADLLHRIVQVVEGKADITTLPEEAAHFLVDMLGDENPIVRGMMNAVKNTTVYQDVVVEYGELYQNNEKKLLKEGVGKMIARAVIQKEKIANMSSFQRFWEAAWRWIKKHLSFLNSTDIEKELAPYMQAADMLLTGQVDVLGNATLHSTDSYYQVTNSNDKELAKKIIEKFTENRVQRDLEKGGYLTIDGKKIKNRVTDAVKAYYKQVYRKDIEKDERNIVLALKGTILHKYLELIGEQIFAGKTPVMSTIQAEVIRQLKDPKDQANAEFLKKDDDFFRLKDADQFGELVRGLQTIKKQILERQERIQKGGEVKFFPELLVYDQYSDVAGTIDLAVVYSNGTVGIYDWKGIAYNPIKGISLVKEQAYDIQISEYKKILARIYGVKTFGETRIVPIEMQFDKSLKGFKTLLMGSDGLNSTKRPHLDQIPVSNEESEDANLNASLRKMQALYETLRKRLQSDYRNERLQARVARLREGIKGLQLRGDVKFIFGEIRALYTDFTARENLTQDHPDFLTDEALNEVRQYIDVYKNFGVNSMETAKRTADDETILKLQTVAHVLETLEQKVNQKLKENLNNGEDFDVMGTAKAEGFMGRLFKQLSKFNRPAFKKLSGIVREVADSTRREINGIVEEMNTKVDALRKWAENRGETLQDAYNRIINDKTLNLVGQFSKEYYDAREQAITNKDFKWFIRNANVEKVGETYQYTGESLKRFNEAKKKYFDYIDRVNQDEALAELREREKDKWRKKYDITSEPNAMFNETNYFIRPQQIESNFSEEYKFMLKPENKPLLDYYNTYVAYNEKFAEMTGKDIHRNFVAEIHKDLIDMIGENGLAGLGGLKDSILRSFEIRDYDLAKGTIDPATGKPVHSIPLFFTDKLIGRLTKKEKEEIRKEVATLYPETSSDFEDEVARRERKLEYAKGTKSKSRDLTRSLILFAESAYSYKHLADTEATALALRDILKAQGQQTTLVDAAGKAVINKFTKKAATILGVPLSEVEAMEQFINLYWYGQSTQGEDISFGKDNQYSGTKAYQMIMKATSATALGLKPILAAGNLLGITSNYYMTGWENRYYLPEDMKEVHKMLVKRDPIYAAASKFWEPYVHNMTLEKANNISVSKSVAIMTYDNLFIMYKKGDEMIDRNVTLAMMRRYGIDEDGKIKRIEKIQGSDKRSLLERSSIKDDKFTVEGLTSKQYSQFRAMIQRVTVGIKGNMPEEDRNLIGTTLAGQAIMHFRNWMPGLIEKRFKSLQYDELFDDHDVGRFRVFFGEFTAKGLIPKLNAFGNLLGEVAFMHRYKEGGINMEVTQKFYDRYMSENPDSNLTIEEFIKLRRDKLTGMAKELQIYLAFALMVFAGKAVIPEEDKDNPTVANRALHLMAQNAFRFTQRGLLEISFFFSPASITTILNKPIPTMNTFNNLAKMLNNTVDETRDVIFGENSKQDKAPPFYYFSKLVPVGSAAVDFFDIFDTYNKDRGY